MGVALSSALPPSTMSSIPITVFTGFLGAGKTSVILSLLPKLPKDYKVVLLKVGTVRSGSAPASDGRGCAERVWRRRSGQVSRRLYFHMSRTTHLLSSELAKQSSLAAVSEILNGCM
jgi:hypothetical protein